MSQIQAASTHRATTADSNQNAVVVRQNPQQSQHPEQQQTVINTSIFWTEKKGKD